MDELSGKLLHYIITGLSGFATILFGFIINSFNSRFDKIETSVSTKANKDDMVRETERLFETLIRIENRLNDLVKERK